MALNLTLKLGIYFILPILSVSILVLFKNLKLSMAKTELICPPKPHLLLVFLTNGHTTIHQIAQANSEVVLDGSIPHHIHLSRQLCLKPGTNPPSFL